MCAIFTWMWAYVISNGSSWEYLVYVKYIIDVTLYANIYIDSHARVSWYSYWFLSVCISVQYLCKYVATQNLNLIHAKLRNRLLCVSAISAHLPLNLNRTGRYHRHCHLFPVVVPRHFWISHNGAMKEKIWYLLIVRRRVSEDKSLYRARDIRDFANAPPKLHKGPSHSGWLFRKIF